MSASRFIRLRPSWRLWNKGEEPARIIYHDCVKHVFLHTGCPQLRHKDRRSSNETTALVGRKQQFVGMPGLQERENLCHALFVGRLWTSDAIESDERATFGDLLDNLCRRI